VELEREKISIELRNTLWSVFLVGIIESKSGRGLKKALNVIWFHYFKWPIDTLPGLNRSVTYGEISLTETKQILRKWFFEAEWHQVMDFIEFIAQGAPEIIPDFNGALKVEMSAYRFIGTNLVEITSEEEVKEIEQSLSLSGLFTPVRTHLETALKHLSNSEHPDYRNSIKESISAIEAIGKIYTKNPNAKLGDALKKLKDNEHVPENFIQAFTKLYAFTNQDNGSRHALKEGSHHDTFEDARFFLVACSAFTNYLIHKMN